MANIKAIYYCEYDGMVVFRMKNDSAKVKPMCECSEYMDSAIRVPAFSHEFIAYGYVAI